MASASEEGGAGYLEVGAIFGAEQEEAQRVEKLRTKPPDPRRVSARGRQRHTRHAAVVRVTQVVTVIERNACFAISEDGEMLASMADMADMAKTVQAAKAGGRAGGDPLGGEEQALVAR